MARHIQWPKITRNTLLFGTGLLLTVNEALIRTGPERPSLYIIFAGMMGLPAFLSKDEKAQEGAPPPSQPTPPPATEMPT